MYARKAYGDMKIWTENSRQLHFHKTWAKEGFSLSLSWFQSGRICRYKFPGLEKGQNFNKIETVSNFIDKI